MALAAELLIVISLIYGLAGPPAQLLQHPASLVSIALGPPPPEQQHLKSSTAAENGRAAPPALKAEAAPLVVPRAIVIPPQPFPAAKAPAASLGPRPGAALQPGPGSGAGGQGRGTGSGTAGNGQGAGSSNGDGGGTDAEWTGGKIKNGDYPKALREAHISGTTVTEVAVGTDGRAAACRVIRTSGSRELDTVTCRLIMERFKFKPARNDAGQAISGAVEYEQEWDAPPPPTPDPNN